MPTVEEERIVRMQFDNKVFEERIRDTIESLGKLKESLKFKKSSEGIDELNRAAKNVNLGTIQTSVDAISSRFTALGVTATTVMANIATDAYQTGKKIVSSLTIQPIKDGLTEYETQMGAIQTILANTKDKGSTMKDVTAALDELNTYADKTIYNFTQMTRNIGTFTAAGVGLEASTQAIKGIANLAAVSGSNAQQASTAMYQLSQALASGTVKLMDWNSVVNAGMGGEVFQNALKRTARNMGIQVDAMIEKAGSFRESLSQGWLTSDVLTQTLAQIAGAYDEASLKAQGYTSEQAAAILDLAKTAEDAATKVKTFTQLIDTLKEALGSGWTKSFEYIFGNFEQAQETFTKISDALGNIISISADSRNALLSDWSSKGGREDLVTGLVNLFWDLAAVILTVKRAFSQIFPPMTSERLLEITKGFRTLTDNLMMNQTTVDGLVGVLKGVFSVLKLGLRVIASVAKGLAPVGKVLLNVASGALTLAGYFGEMLSKFLETIDVSKLVSAGFEKIQNAAEIFIMILAAGILKVAEFISNVAKLAGTNDTIKGVVAAFGSLYNFAANGLGKAVVFIANFISAVNESSVATTIVNGLAAALNVLINIATLVGGVVVASFKAIVAVVRELRNAPNIFVGITNAAKKLFSIVKEFFQNSKFSEIFEKAKTAFGDLKDSIVEFVDKVNSKLATLDTKTLLAMAFGASLTLLVLSLSQLARSASTAVTTLTDTFGALKKTVTSIQKTFNDLGNKLKSSTLFQAAMAIGLLVGSVIMLSKIPFNDLAKGTVAVLLLTGAFAGLVALASRLGAANVALTMNSKAMLTVAASVLILTSAMAMLGKVTVSQDWLKQLAMITVLLGEVVGWSMLMGHFTPQLSKGGLMLLAFAFSIEKIVKTLAGMSNIDTAQIDANFKAVAESVALLSVLAVAASKVKFGSGAALLMVIGSLIAMEKALAGFTNEPIDKQKVINQIGVLGAVFGSLAALSVFSGKFGSVELGKNALKLSTGLFIMTADILLIAKALDKVSTIDNSVFENSKETLKGIMASIAVMTVYLGLMSTSFETMSMKLDLGKNALKLAAGIAIMTVSMKAMTGLIKTLGTMTPNELQQGQDAVIALGVLVGVLIGVTALTENAKVGPILSMVAALGAVVGSLVVLTLFDPVKLITSAAAIGIALAGLGAAFYGLGKMQNAQGIKDVIFTVVEIIALLGGVTYSLIKLSDISWETLVASAGSLSVVMLALAAAMEGARGSTLTDAAAMAIVVASTVGAAFSLAMLADIPWQQLVTAAGSLSVTMIALAAATKIANGTITGAASMAILSASVVALSYAFQVLSEVDFNTLLPNLIALGVSVGALAVLGAISAVFPPFAVGLIAVAGAFTVFSVGAVLFGVGAKLVSSAANSMVTALERLAEIGPEKVSNIQNTIVTSITAIGTGIGQAISQIITNIASGIGTGIVMITVSIATGIAVMSTTVTTMLQQAGHDAIAGLLNGISDGLGSVLGAGVSIGKMVIQGLRDSLDWHSPSVMTMLAGSDSIAGLVIGIVKNLPKANAAGEVAGTEVLNGLASVDTSASGNALVDGVIAGIKESAPGVYGVASWLGKVFNSAFGNAVRNAGGNGEYAYKDSNAKAKENAEKYGKDAMSTSKLIGVSAMDRDLKLKQNANKANEERKKASGGADNVNKLKEVRDYIDSFKDQVSDSVGDMVPDLGDLTKGLGDVSSGLDKTAGASKGSGAASQADAQDKETEAKYIKYVTETAKEYSATYDSINAKMGANTGIDAAKDAVERFAMAMAAASDGASTASSGVDSYKKQFIELYESVESAVTGLDKFGTLSRSIAKTSPKTYIKNLKENSAAVTNWGNALGVLAQKGYSSDIIKKIINDGVSDTSAFNSLLYASAEEVRAINAGYVDIQNQASTAANKSLAAMTAAAELAAKRKEMQQTELTAANAASSSISDINNQTVQNTENATKSIEANTTFVQQLYTDMAMALEQTIQSQIDIFGKFNRDSDSTKEELLDNMRSQVAGIQAWGDDLELLASKSELSDELLEHLRSLGQDGYSYVHEFTRMSGEELSEASMYFQQLQALPQETSVRIADSLSSLRNAFNVPIDTTGITDQASKAGENFAQGFANGIDTASANGKATELGNNSVNTLKASLDEHSPSKITEEVGLNFALGLVNGIENGTILVLDAIKKLGESMLDEICEVLDINSPSKEMELVGKWSDKGLANGLLNSLHFVTDSAKAVGQTVLDSAKAGINSFMSIDLNREITPRIAPVVSCAGIGPMNGYQRFDTSDGYSRSMISSINALKDQKMNNIVTNKVKVDNAEVVSAITDLRKDVNGLKDSMSNLQVVMDTGATVGALAPGIDRELGKKNIMTGRGN